MTANTTQSLFLPGDTFLHRLHPMTKLTFSLAAAAVIFGGPGTWLSAILPGLLAFTFLWRAGLAGPVFRAIFRLIIPLAVVLFLVHGLFNPNNHTVLLRMGPFAVGQEGLVYAAVIVIRLMATLAASLPLVMSTHPARLVQALEEAGLHPNLAYLVGSPFLLLPQLAGRAQSIQAAQQARGLETQGTLVQRIRALFPLVAPLVFSALVDVEERSLALEVRGFSSPNRKTSLIQLADTPGQKVSRWFMIVLSAALVLAGFWWRVNGSH